MEYPRVFAIFNILEKNYKNYKKIELRLIFEALSSFQQMVWNEVTKHEKVKHPKKEEKNK